ncbi:RNA polymerase sigma factor [Alkaliphilus serpentinus]|uniref:RNA polymerase sigma factor n=1 Tax=Alkaliphilus serpentinus TaxID=1482731 RepID=UPI001FAAD48D|nr:sigma-70 family RNA polymerase sigma factor [Alkaliphilus serpentinus]
MKQLSPEEISLVERTKQGDVDSFERLIQPYQKKAYNIAYRMLGNVEDASDATQEALIKIYKSIGNFQGNSKFSTWLYAIVTNTCIDFIRKNRRAKIIYLDREKENEEGTYQMEIADDINTPEEILEKKETRFMIHDAINQLNHEHREIIVLRDIQGFTYQEIADILKCSEGTVKSRISRARGNLRQLLGERMKA